METSGDCGRRPLRFFSRSIERNANRRRRRRPSAERNIRADDAAPKKCRLCENTFDSLSSFVSHLSEHGDRRACVFCDACGAFFAKKSKLVRHLLTHSGLKSFECGRCDAKFNNASSLRKHGLIHSGFEPYECKTCERRFRDSSNLRKHQLKHEGHTHACPDCGKRYKSRWSLVVHARSHANDAPWVCSECPRSFYTKKDRNRHQIAHTDLKQFTCAWCKADFGRKDSLDRHVRNAHSADVQSQSTECLLHVGEKCENDRPEEANLRRRIETDVPSRPECDVRLPGDSRRFCDFSDAPKRCPLCQIRFDRLGPYVRHVSGRGDRRTYVCDGCGDVFDVESKITAHPPTRSGNVTAVSTAPFVPKYDADSPGGRAPSRSSVERETHREEFPESSGLKKHRSELKGRTYACPDCDKRYKSKWSLVVHSRSHTRDASWTCPRCPSTFYTKKDRNRHEITHTDLKQFGCSQCDANFRRKDNLDRHVRNVHSADVSESKRLVDEENRLRILEANNLRESVIIEAKADVRKDAPERLGADASGPPFAVGSAAGFDSDARYVHKKVHYDVVKSPPFSKYADFDDEKARRFIDRYSSNSDANEAKPSFSADTIELYKKILCPSYKNDS